MDKYVNWRKKTIGGTNGKSRVNAMFEYYFASYPFVIILTPIVWNMKSELVTYILLYLWFFIACLNPYTQGYLWSARSEGSDLSGTIALALMQVLTTVLDGIMIWFTGYLIDTTSPEWAFTIP